MVPYISIFYTIWYFDPKIYWVLTPIPLGRGGARGGNYVQAVQQGERGKEGFGALQAVRGELPQEMCRATGESVFDRSNRSLR